MTTSILSGALMRAVNLASAIVLASSCLFSVKAESAPPFWELLQQSEARAPFLLESASSIRAAQGQALQATVRPNPTLGLDIENFGQSEPYQGLSNAQTTLSLSQAIEFGGKRVARTEAGNAGVIAAQARSRQAAVDFGYELAIAYATAEVAQARIALFDDASIAAQEDLRATRALVNAGREADLRAVQAQSEASAAQADLEAARAGAQNAFAQLATLSGAQIPYTGVAPSLLPLATNLRVPLVEPPLSSLAVVAAETERDAAMRRVAVERSLRIPDVTTSLGVRRISGDRSTVFVGGLSVPLPLFDQNRGNIATAAAQLEAAEARLAAARLGAANGYRAAAAQARATDGRVAATNQAEAAAEEAYRLARIGYDAGRSPLIELLFARRSLTAAHAAALDARLTRIAAEAALARFLGRTPFGEGQ